MRGFSVDEGKITIPLNTQAMGDVTVVVYHARSTFGGKVQGKVYLTVHQCDVNIKCYNCMHVVTQKPTYVITFFHRLHQ